MEASTGQLDEVAEDGGAVVKEEEANYFDPSQGQVQGISHHLEKYLVGDGVKGLLHVEEGDMKVTVEGAAGSGEAREDHPLPIGASGRHKARLVFGEDVVFVHMATQGNVYGLVEHAGEDREDGDGAVGGGVGGGLILFRDEGGAPLFELGGEAVVEGKGEETTQLWEEVRKGGFDEAGIHAIRARCFVCRGFDGFFHVIVTIVVIVVPKEGGEVGGNEGRKVSNRGARLGGVSGEQGFPVGHCIFDKEMGMVGRVNGGSFPLEGTKEGGEIAMIDAADGGKLVPLLGVEFGRLEEGTGSLECLEGSRGVAGAVLLTCSFKGGVGSPHISVLHPRFETPPGVSVGAEDVGGNGCEGFEEAKKVVMGGKGSDGEAELRDGGFVAGEGLFVTFWGDVEFPPADAGRGLGRRRGEGRPGS